MADPALWFPGARLNQLAPVDGGSILGGRPKLLWHTTQGSGFPPYSTNFWPHFTINPATGEVRQHIPANRAGRALQNLEGGIQTNRWNCLQAEVIGFADAARFHPVMAELALWARDQRGVPRTTAVDWHRPYNNGQVPSSFGSWPGRLTNSEWSNYTGHLAHMHCAENVHGDTGWPFPIDQILEGDDVPYTEAQLTEFAYQGALDAIRRATNGSRDSEASLWFDDLKARLEETFAQVTTMYQLAARGDGDSGFSPEHYMDSLRHLSRELRAVAVALGVPPGSLDAPGAAATVAPDRVPSDQPA
jgi:hypothetical protein